MIAHGLRGCVVLAASSVILTAWACGSGGGSSSNAQGTAATPGTQSSPPAGNGVAIDFASTPDPLERGDNAITVTVTAPDGSPVTDATVTAVFSMPAMPAMNMPAMRSEAPLEHVGNGRYQGTGQLSMGGTWNIAITATRGAEKLGSRQLSLVANQ